MTPSKEELETYFNELSHFDKDGERVWFWAGIAAYCHLSSQGSNQWRKEHGFETIKD